MAGIKEKINLEIEKIKKMDSSQKKDYFKTYYLAKTIVALIILILLVWFIKDTFFQKKIANSGCVYGIELSEEERSALTDGYLTYYGYNYKKYVSYVSTDNMFEGTEQKMDASTHEMALFAQIAAGEIYYLILDKENFERMSNGSIYMPLDEAFQGGIPEIVKPDIVELTDAETGETYMAAIDLTNTGIFDDSREKYLVFTVGIPDKEYPERFLEYIFNM